MTEQVTFAVMINQKVTNTYGWTLHRYTFDQLFEWLSVPHRSSEATAQFDAMTGDQRDKLKQQAQAFVMGTLDGNRRKAEFIRSRSAFSASVLIVKKALSSVIVAMHSKKNSAHGAIVLPILLRRFGWWRPALAGQRLR